MARNIGFTDSSGKRVTILEDSGIYFLPNPDGSFQRLATPDEIAELFIKTKPSGNEISASKDALVGGGLGQVGVVSTPGNNEAIQAIRRNQPEGVRDILLNGIETTDLNRLNFVKDVFQKLDSTGAIRKEDKSLVDRFAENRVIEQQKAQAEQEVDNFLFEAPQEAARQREAFINRQADAGGEFLEEVAAPSILKELNARSPMLVRGGQVMGLLQNESAEVVGRLQELAAQLEEEDFNFFANASYQNTIRKLTESATTARAEVDFQRQSLRTGQENRFISGQNQLDRDLNMNLFARQQERNLRAQQSKFNVQRQKDEEAQNAANIQTGAQIVGQVGTAAILSKYG